MARVKGDIHDLTHWAIFYRSKEGSLSDIYLAFSEERDSTQAIRQAINAGFMTQDEWAEHKANTIQGRWVRVSTPGYDGHSRMLDDMQNWQ